MKISIITVCLNAQDTIEDTFLSILNQTYKNTELIVIDGGSTDGTLEIIDKYKEKISSFISEPDNGIYDAMNKGIALATGDFIFFLNANDVFYNELVLEKVATNLIKNPEAKFLFGDVDYISKDKQSSKILTFENIKNDYSLILDNICHQSIFYHKSLFEQLGLYSEEFNIYADWDFNIKCLVENKTQALYLPIPISKFQLGGICSNPANKSICEFEKKVLIKKHYYKYRFLFFINDFSRKNLSWIYKYIIYNLFIKKFIDLIVHNDKEKLLLINII